MNIAHLLATPLAERASAAALVEGRAPSRRTTFAELDLLSRRMSAKLKADGVRAGDLVLFFAPPSAALYAALIATWRIGAVATFVEQSAGRHVLDAACDLCAPRALIASPKAHLLRLVSRGLRRIPRKYALGGRALFATTLDRTTTPPDDDIATVAADDLALLTFTSGSTGAPKGAMRTHAILRAQLAALTSAFAARPGDCEMVALPIVVLLNLANGVETVLPDADLRRPDAIDAAPVLHQLRASHVTRLVGSPAFLERLADPGGIDRASRTSDLGDGTPATLAGLTTIITGGGPVFPDLVHRLSLAAPDATIIAVYGSTEAEPIAHIAHREVSAVDLEAMGQGAGLLTGHTVPDVQLRLLRVIEGPINAHTQADFDALAVAPGDAGEIVVSGHHVVRGYWRGVGDSETKIHVGNAVWHRTGDLGRLDDRGRLWLLGRVNASRGDARGTFHPFAVECAARVRLHVRHVAAFTRSGRRVLVLQAGEVGKLSTADVQRALSWAAIDEVPIVTRIPMDRRHNSKVDYPALMRQLR